MITYALPVKLQKSFSYEDESTDLDELKPVFGNLNIEKGKYFYGYASVDVVDSDGDRITLQALSNVANDLLISPYNKIFLSHNYSDIAIGKIVGTSMDDRGLLILAKLNEAHERGEETWKSINDGYLDAFSIGGQFVKTEMQYDAELKREVMVATKIKAREVSLTSIPANPKASLLGAFEKARKAHSLLKSETYLKDKEQDISMVEEVKKIPEAEEVKEETKKTIEDNSKEDIVIEKAKKPITKEEVKTPVEKEVIEEPKVEEVKEEKEQPNSVEKNTDTGIPEEPKVKEPVKEYEPSNENEVAGEIQKTMSNDMQKQLDTMQKALLESTEKIKKLNEVIENFHKNKDLVDGKIVRKSIAPGEEKKEEVKKNIRPTGLIGFLSN